MKFISILKADNNREECIEKMNEEINKFKYKYKDYPFELYFPDAAHLIVQIRDSHAYCEEIHNDLCETFDVNLHYVTHWHQEQPNNTIKNIELIYTPVHHYTDNLEWEDIILSKSIQFE